MKILKKLSFGLLMLVLFTSCAIQGELSQRNFATQYDPRASFTSPVYRLQHLNDSTTLMWYSFQWSDFLYQRPGPGSAYAARASLSGTLRKEYESKEVTDSVKLTLVDSVHFGHNHWQTASLQLPARFGNDYILEMVLKDDNRGAEVEAYLPIYKTDRWDQQDFLLRDSLDQLIYNNYISEYQSFYLESPVKGNRSLVVRYYHRDFPISIPPFVIDYGEPFDYEEDSLFTLSIQDGRTPLMTLPGEGFYHFQADTGQKAGFTLYRFPEGFPEVTTIRDILGPMRYITTSREYEVLSGAEQTKMAIDSFWLENSGNINRAKMLISKYYNRVQEANQYFTSYLEGWKTDRGMIYLVFGPPTNVYRGTNTETWVYGEAGNTRSLRFSFIRVNNPFSYNDYSLYRNPLFKDAWYNAVENWRR